MGMFTTILIFIVTLAISVLLIGIFLRNSRRIGLVDIPNKRSLHSDPTPRGGGLVIGIILLAGTTLLALFEWVPYPVAIAMVAGGGIVFLIGGLDDWQGLPVLVRVSAYLLASVLAVIVLGGLTSITLGAYTFKPGIYGNIIAVLWLTWLTNLYNFMDGTDGLAATEAVYAGIFAWFMFYTNGQQGLALVCVLLAASCLGFLKFNWQPAKIFMGDSGSCLIGFCFGLLAITGEKTNSLPLLGWIILLSIFLCDTTFTLLRRVFGGEKWYSPHRTHTYQLLVRNKLTHKQLAIIILAINIFILGPLTIIANENREYLSGSCITVCIVLFLVWAVIQYRFFFRAGLLTGQADE